MQHSVMSQHSKPELSSECAKLLGMKHEKSLEMKSRSCQSILTSNSVFLLVHFRLAEKPLEIKAGLVHHMMGTAECQRGTCSGVNAIEGTGKVWAVLASGWEWSWAKQGCGLQETLAA